MQVNRYLEDKAMDRIDHALGRPIDPTGNHYRNCYATSHEIADEMAASPYWRESSPSFDMRFFQVTDEGREALKAHLKAIGDPHRAYVVEFDGYADTVVGKTPAKARYSRYLDFSDVMPDLTFFEFCKRSKIRAER